MESISLARHKHLKIKRFLSNADPVMAGLVAHPATQMLFSIRSTPAKRKPHYHSLVTTIVNQQLSVKAGGTINQRLLALQADKVNRAASIDRLSDKQIRQCGISQRKLSYIRALTQSVLNHEIHFSSMARQSDEVVVEKLTGIPGIGRWSAEMFLLWSFNRVDVLPLGDLVLRKSFKHHYHLDGNDSDAAYLEIAEAWRPYRSFASKVLWALAPEG